MNSVVLYTGGLGNQLFQFVFMLFLKEKMGISPKFNRSYYVKHPVHSGFEADKVFDFQSFEEDHRPLYDRYAFAVGVRNRTGIRLGKRVFCEENDFDLKKKFPVYKGYWQKVCFFEAVQEKLQEYLLPIDHYADSYLLEQIKNTDAVMLHVRRGDYCGNDRYCDLSKSGYYAKAIQTIREKVNTPKFFVFSDNVNWCKQYFADEPEFTYVEYANQSTLGDLVLMKHCKHAVIANSSFSWWGAALGKKEHVLYPNSYYTKEDAGDLYPDTWQSIACD